MYVLILILILNIPWKQRLLLSLKAPNSTPSAVFGKWWTLHKQDLKDAWNCCSVKNFLVFGDCLGYCLVHMFDYEKLKLNKIGSFQQIVYFSHLFRIGLPSTIKWFYHPIRDPGSFNFILGMFSL